MKLKVLTLKLNVDNGTFDTDQLDQFQSDGREVIEVSEHYFQHDHIPSLALVVRYRDINPVTPGDQNALPRKEWRNDLDAKARQLYDMLRDWRSRRAHKEGMPSFLILNNRQLAAISAAQPASLTALRGVEGIGESRSIRWGQEILGVVAAALGRSVEQATPSPATDTGATASSKSVHESEMPEVSEPVYVAQSVPAVQPTLFSAEGENVS